ncbi:FtsW/RodA/SpoVE family cell cycle protein [Paenibacillus albus]|uniref:FtsW/RodA/SpoVE family cell cycle protein n=1 Tax=Paenibacillus albus TaxID=2495582 RepID=A0A3Q8X556_9BACL|nr:FtsW/RodA/SpoVE family cell cycle protein [Paenibacillus albus]AZN40773.1 hypothetical protein EJC50_14720 [Paenibacillus albus]
MKSYPPNESALSELAKHPLLQAYLAQVCSHIRMKEVHDDIREELLSHLLDIIEEKIDQDGESEEQVIQFALIQMGDSETLGKQFNAAHKPKKDYGMIGLVAGMILFGLVTLFAVKVSLVDGLLEHKLLYAGIGIVAMFGMYFVNYRKILHFAEPLYAGTVGLMLFTLWHGVEMNGLKQWLILPGNIAFPVFAISPYFLITAIAGMILHDKEARSQISARRSWWITMKQIILYMGIPLALYFKSPALIPLIIYSLSLAVLLLITRQWKLLAAGICGVLLVITYIYVLNAVQSQYLLERHTAFLHPKSMGYYQTGRSLEAIRTAGLWGHGIDAVNDRLPYRTGEFVFSYLIYSFGWVFGWCAGLLVLLFIVRMYLIGLRIKDRISRGLFISLGSILCLQLAWNVLMCLGLLPVVGLSLPIVNWSSTTIVDLAVVGYILGMYRRKDLDRTAGLIV